MVRCNLGESLGSTTLGRQQSLRVGAQATCTSCATHTHVRQPERPHAQRLLAEGSSDLMVPKGGSSIDLFILSSDGPMGVRMGKR
jgi:hypothetical protein